MRVYYADGACRNNGTTDYYAYGSYCAEGMQPRKIRFAFDEASTNNEAEYMTLIRLLEALQKSHEFVEIRMDSQLVVQQVTGNFETRKPQLQRLRNRVRQLINLRGKVELRWIPREQMVEAVGH